MAVLVLIKCYNIIALLTEWREWGQPCPLRFSKTTKYKNDEEKTAKTAKTLEVEKMTPPSFFTISSHSACMLNTSLRKYDWKVHEEFKKNPPGFLYVKYPQVIH